MVRGKQPYVSWKGEDNLVSAVPIESFPVRDPNAGDSCGINCEPHSKVLLEYRKQLIAPSIKQPKPSISQMERPGGSVVIGVGREEELCGTCGNATIIQALTWPKVKVFKQGTIINRPESNQYGICISCDPENNVIRRATIPRIQNNISLITYLQSRCRTPYQTSSTQKIPGIQYINPTTKLPNLPNDTNNTEKYQGKGCYLDCPIVYKPNNPEFACQGAVSNGARLRSKVHNEITVNGGAYGTAAGLAAQRFGYFTENTNSDYLVKSKPVPCKEQVFLGMNRRFYASTPCTYKKIEK